jgi:hypothetical protein
MVVAVLQCTFVSPTAHTHLTTGSKVSACTVTRPCAESRVGVTAWELLHERDFTGPTHFYVVRGVSWCAPCRVAALWPSRCAPSPRHSRLPEPHLHVSARALPPAPRVGGAAALCRCCSCDAAMPLPQCGATHPPLRRARDFFEWFCVLALTLLRYLAATPHLSVVPASPARMAVSPTLVAFSRARERTRGGPHCRLRPCTTCMCDVCALCCRATSPVACVCTTSARCRRGGW